MDPYMTYLSYGLLAGLGTWLFQHSVNRRLHLNGGKPISEEVFEARLQGLEDRLGGQLASLRTKLEDMERYTRQIERRLDKMLRF